LRCGRVLLLALLVIATFAVTGTAIAQAPESEGEDGSQDSKPTVKPRTDEQTMPDQIIVKFKKDTSSSTRADVRRQEGLEKKKDLDLIKAEVYEVKGQSAEAAVRALNRRPDVEYATPDRKVYPTGYADEPRFAELWGLHNTGQAINDGPTGTANVDVNGKEASTRNQGKNVTVAVIDDGVDFSHPDLKDRAWKNPGESGAGKETNGVDDDTNGKVDDLYGWDFYNNDNTVHHADDYHGTHVAGTIGASINDEGIVGVAPNVKIMALKFLGGPDGSGTISDAIEAIGYAKSKGAKISNNSWGYLGSPDPALKDAIGASGQLFVAAAGNGGSDNDANPDYAEYPASYASSNILSVTAIDNRGNLASFSNYGARTVDISAPGVEVLSSIPTSAPYPGTTLSSVGTSGKAITAGFGAEEIGDGASAQASFMTKAFTAVGRTSEPVVLVDDDRSHVGNPDVGPILSGAIHSATGTAPQVLNVADGDGPALSQLSGKIVVWATGQAFNSGTGATTLTSADQTTLTNLLDGSGKLILTGMDALWNIEASRFVTGTLSLNVKSDVTSTAFEGTSGTAFEGESYDLSGAAAVPDYHDKVAPTSAAAVPQGTLNNLPWAYFNGTSMAAPYATGTAALVASKYPSYSPTSIKAVILSSGKKASATNGKTVTGKMADARAALYPRVTAVFPAANVTGVAKTANVTATFSEAMNATTINTTTFTLVKSGTTTPIGAAVSYDSTKKKATLNPSVDLAPNTTYKATVKNGSSGVKNAVGDPMLVSKSWSFTTGA
jgi:subtilisin family serine protease